MANRMRTKIKFDSEIKETQIKSLKVEDDQEKTNNCRALACPVG